jgi:hypothetical protein
MNNPFKDKRKDLSDSEDEVDEKFIEYWSQDDENSLHDDKDFKITKEKVEDLRAKERRLLAKEKRYSRLERPARPARVVPPLPPVPPVPPLPSDIKILKSDKVIGIRGLNSQLYKDISKIAKKNHLSVGELLNRVLAKYRYNSFGEERDIISHIDSLELIEEELGNLEDPISIINVKTLLLAPDITTESFKKIEKIENIERVWVPSHLYLTLLKKARHCIQIEKYKGEILPQVVQKRFDSDLKLSQSFIQYFIETEQQVDLTVHGDLQIDSDVTLDNFKDVIYSLRVDGDIEAPNPLVGYLFAKAKVYGEIIEK